MSEIEFKAWPKTARLYREVIVTEKIDGTNAAVGITDDGVIYAQSRSRLIVPGDDNFGFAAWVQDNTASLVLDLGVGLHFGEWWGSGVQRGYGLAKGEKRFSLFNVNRFDGTEFRTSGLSVVPVLYRGSYDDACIQDAWVSLASHGSAASPGFMNPEGICIFHTQSRQVYKYTPADGDGHKGANSTKWSAA